MGGRILRRTAIVVVVGVLVGGGGTALAGHPGSCPAGFSTVSASVDPVVDKNGDGWICTRQIPGPPGQGPFFSDIDNNAQLSH
jgi:hypothetical protein